nr:hypothetical protein [uncultured Albidiferax sp.]
MGIAKRMWMEQQQQDYEDERAVWIRDKLGDDDADEDTPGWGELERQYDAGGAHEIDYEYEYGRDEWAVRGKTRIEIFDENIKSAREILNVSLEPAATRNLLVMLHAHVVTAVEAYLSSRFIEVVLSSDENMRRLVESDPEFANRTFTIKEIFTKSSQLKNDINIYLRDFIFHNLKKVKPMYGSVLNVDFGDIKWLFQAVALRHDCVHRAGYDKDGNEAAIDKKSIEKLIADCQTLVHSVEGGVVAGLSAELQSLFDAL